MFSEKDRKQICKLRKSINKGCRGCVFADPRKCPDYVPDEWLEDLKKSDNIKFSKGVEKNEKI